jgi:Mlc titration factor MtfA (ptsG expression regulator)
MHLKPWSEILSRAQFPQRWEEILQQHVRFYQLLNDNDRRELKSYVRWFIASKQFEGCEGLIITDDIRVSVAAQACLLLLHRDTPCYERLHVIRIYPSDEFPVSSRSSLVGECWQIGVILLAWDSVRAGAANPSDGDNVVLHEFAHLLDYEDGHSDGIPLLARGITSTEASSARASWLKVLSREFEDFCLNLKTGKETVMDEYGATNPSEFFAVATECFFEKSSHVRDKHPNLYAALKEFYKQDPAAWTTNRIAKADAQSSF